MILPLIRYLLNSYPLSTTIVNALVAFYTEKRNILRPRRRLEDNITMDLKETGVNRGIIISKVSEKGEICIINTISRVTRRSTPN